MGGFNVSINGQHERRTVQRLVVHSSEVVGLPRAGRELGLGGVRVRGRESGGEEGREECETWVRMDRGFRVRVMWVREMWVRDRRFRGRSLGV